MCDTDGRRGLWPHVTRWLCNATDISPECVSGSDNNSQTSFNGDQLPEINIFIIKGASSFHHDNYNLHNAIDGREFYLFYLVCEQKVICSNVRKFYTEIC